MFKPFTIAEFAAFMGISKRMAAELVATEAVRFSAYRATRPHTGGGRGRVARRGVRNKEDARPLHTVDEVNRLAGWTSPTRISTSALERLSQCSSVVVG